MALVPQGIELPTVETASRLFSYFDWGATLLWATSGAMLGARRGYDIVGVFVVALVSAAGGGLMRDGIFLQHVPVLVRSPVYLGLIAAATIAVAAFGGYLKTRRWLGTAVAVVDAIGLGAYAVVGMSLAIAAHLPFFGVLLVGLVNAVGGSLLRDILIGAEAQLFKPGVLLGLAALAGCIVFLALVYLGVDGEYAAPLTVALVFTVRVIALRFDLRSRPLRAFEEDWREQYDESGNRRR